MKETFLKHIYWAAPKGHTPDILKDNGAVKSAVHSEWIQNVYNDLNYKMDALIHQKWKINSRKYLIYYEASLKLEWSLIVRGIQYMEL